MRAPTGRLIRTPRRETANPGLARTGMLSKLKIGKLLVRLGWAVSIICPDPIESPGDFE